MHYRKVSDTIYDAHNLSTCRAGVFLQLWRSKPDDCGCHLPLFINGPGVKSTFAHSPPRKIIVKYLGKLIELPFKGTLQA